MKPNLTVVDSEQDPNELQIDNVSAEDIKNINIDKLRDAMVRNIFVTEAALFQQAGFEYKRISNARKILNDLEADLFTDVSIQNLNPDQKIKLYNTVSANMKNSLEFLGDLHGNITSGIDTISKIEQLKTQTDTVRRSDETGGGAALDDVRKIILNQIKSKSLNK